ncbi:MAG: glycosyltransferase [Candidatus Lokiarchaeota archaeon]|nr:glycosyltransferase [Candidatus Lokiarchaeota archaeon]
MPSKIALIAFDCWYHFNNILNVLKNYSDNFVIIVPYGTNIKAEFKNYFEIYYIRYKSGLIADIKSSKAFISILRILRLNKVKTVHITSARPFWLFPIYFLFRFNPNKKLIFTIHEPFKREGDISTKFMYRFYLYPDRYLSFKLADYLIFGGKKILNKAKKEIITPARLIYAELGAYTYLDNLKSQSSDFNENQIIFFGRIQAYKGLHILIESTKHLETEDFKIIIAGKGSIDYNAQVNHLLNSKKLRIYNRYIKDGELVAMIRSSAVAVFPYLSGTQSGATSTALGLNVPVISSEIGSIHEIIKEGKTGYIIPPNNPKILAEKLDKILNNRSLQREMRNCIMQENLKINSNLRNKLVNLYSIF